MSELKPCPFCGGEAYEFACDRLIEIGCDRCKFHLSFHGIVQSEINTGVPIVYSGGKKSDYEWYDKNARLKAAEAWNRRVHDVV